MTTLFLYLLQSSASMALFYLLYIVFFRKETFYRYNRILLLSAFLFSALCPLLPIPGIQHRADDTVVSVSFNTAAAETISVPQPGIQSVAPEHSWWDGVVSNWNTILLSIYLTVAILLLALHVIQLLKIRQMLRTGKRHEDSDATYIHLRGLRTPFSFMHYVFLDPEAYEPAELEHIVLHEAAHVAQKHTLDNLMASLYCCVCWINPFAWWAKRSMQLNLEYLADQAALEQIPAARAYQYSLLKTASICHSSSIANHFSKSFIKNRIVMINTTKSNRLRVWKYLLALPVLALAAGLLAASNPAAVKDEPGAKYLQKVNGTYYILITPKTTDEDIAAMRKQLQKDGFDLNIINSQRNSKKEFSALTARVSSKGATATSDEMNNYGKPVECAFFTATLKNKSVSAGSAPYAEGEDVWPSSLLRVAASETAFPIRGLTTDSTFARRFPGGADAYSKYLSQTIRYPQSAVSGLKTGIVLVQYKLHADGAVSDALISNHPAYKADKALEDELLRVVKTLPKFNAIPGAPVETVTMSARFMLYDGDKQLGPKDATGLKHEVVVVGYAPAKK